MLFQAFTLEAFIKPRRMPGLFTRRLQLKARHFHTALTFRATVPRIPISFSLEVLVGKSWFSLILHSPFVAGDEGIASRDRADPWK